MTTCKACRAALPDGARFCSNCGSISDASIAVVGVQHAFFPDAPINMDEQKTLPPVGPSAYAPIEQFPTQSLIIDADPSPGSAQRGFTPRRNIDPFATERIDQAHTVPQEVWPDPFVPEDARQTLMVSHPNWLPPSNVVPSSSDDDADTLAASLDFLAPMRPPASLIPTPAEPPVHGPHWQPYNAHGLHQQPQNIHALHQQPGQLHAPHQQPLATHAAHHQPLLTHAAHSKRAAKGCRPSCLTTTISSAVVVTILTVSLLVVYFNRHTSNAAPPTPPALSMAGNASPGQSISFTGNHFAPDTTVLVTIDGQPLSATIAPIQAQLTGNAPLELLQGLTGANSNGGTFVKVHSDGTFHISIHVNTQWSVGSSHTLQVDDTQGQLLKSIIFTIQPGTLALSPTTTPTPAPTPAPSATPTPTPTPAPTATPTPTPAPTATPVPPTPTPVPPTPTPTPTQQQLTGQSALSQTANTTGQGTTPAQAATGTVAFTNSDPNNGLTLAADTVLTSESSCNAGVSLQVSLDSAVQLPASSSSDASADPTVSVTVHVVNPTGSAGNISDCGETPAFEICTGCSSEIGFRGNTSTINNTSTFSAPPEATPTPTSLPTGGNSQFWRAESTTDFTGGVDAQSYTTVQQSDIDTAATALKTTTTQNATAALQKQVPANEHLVGTPQCNSQVQANHQAGDKAATVTVSVTTTCTATAST